MDDQACIIVSIIDQRDLTCASPKADPPKLDSVLGIEAVRPMAFRMAQR